jgi:hypothetical protein
MYEGKYNVGGSDLECPARYSIGEATSSVGDLSQSLVWTDGD